MPGDDTLRIRMYNVGFGDCFLMWLPAADGRPRTVLVDCGSHLSGRANKLSDVWADIVAATKQPDGVPRIDVVIASHRHFDHISGFDWKGWDDVEVGEVWLPWTEERDAPDADRIREKQHRIALALSRVKGLDPSTSFLVQNALSNAGAEETLLNGFAGRPVRRYLPAKDAATDVIPTAILGDGTIARVLGPSRDEAIIGLLEPPKNEAFEKNPRPPAHGAAGGGAAGAGAAGGTGGEEEASAPPPRPPLFAARYVREDAGAVAAELGADEQLLGKLRAKAEFDLFAAAAQLDDAINGTSLVLAFEVAGHVLIFAGDAEWGTWSVILADAATRALLSRTTVYKVSHHGSYNGSPRTFVEQLLPAGAISLMSFKPVEKWPSIPPDALTDALGSAQRRLLRSDKLAELAVDPSLARHPKDLWVDLSLPATGRAVHP